MLLVPKPGGDKYATAIRYDTPCVNLLWLRDALLCKKEALNGGWKSEKYKVNNATDAIYALCLDDNHKFDADLLATWRNPIKIEADFVQRAKLLKIDTLEDDRSMQPPVKKQRTTYKASPRVLFTGFSDSERQDLQEKVQAIGGEIAKEMLDLTHLVTRDFKRTAKWFCAIHTAKFVVKPEWVVESFNSKWFLDEEKFWLKDDRSEHMFQFSIRNSIARAQEHRVFNGYVFALLSQNVQPAPRVLHDIVRCGGGKVLSSMPSVKALKQVKKLRDEDPKSCRPVLVLASHDKADSDHVRLLRECGVPCYNAELVLTASLKQRIDLQPFLINPPTTR